MDAVAQIGNLGIPGVNGKQRLENHTEVYMLSGLEYTEWQKQHEILSQQGGIRELTSKNLFFVKICFLTSTCIWVYFVAYMYLYPIYTHTHMDLDR